MANVISLPYSTSSGTYGSTLSNTYQWYVQWYQYPTITDTMKSSNAYMKINSFTNNGDSTVVANISIYSQNAITRTGTSGYTCSTFTFKSQPTILLYNKTLGTSIPIYNVALTTTVADNGTGATVSSSITHSSTINVNIPESWFEEENRYWYFTISDILTIVDTSSTLTNTKTFETFVVDALYDVFVRKDVKLPDGYAMLSYIEGTGTQYIDTGFKPNENTRLVLDIDIGTQSSYPMALLGSRNGDTNSNASFVIFIMTASQFRTDFGSATANANISTSGRFLIDKNKSTCNINGTLYENTNTTFQSDYTLSILTENDSSGYDTRITKGKIYSCQIYDNDILIRDYIPCLNPSNIAGLYDLVNGVFYGDSAGGTFLFDSTTVSAQSSQTNARLYKAVNVWVKKDGVLYPMKSVYSKVGG